MIELSIVVPAFNEENSLIEIADRIEHTLAEMGKAESFEIIFVDDGSKDGSRDILQKLAKERPFVSAVFLRQNAGKSMALMAGFFHCEGQYVVTMDADLQDLPEDIPLLWKQIQRGFDCVCGWRTQRLTSWSRIVASRIFNLAAALATGLKLHDMNCGFKMFRRSATKNLYLFGDFHRYIPLLIHIQGFKVTEVPIRNDMRKYGESRYKALRYEGVLDLMTILFTYRFGVSPLHFFAGLSALLIVPGLTVLAILVARHILWWFGAGEQLVDRPLLSLSLTMIMVGIQVFLTGFVCDFLLHHTMREKLEALVAANVEKVL